MMNPQTMIKFETKCVLLKYKSPHLASYKAFPALEKYKKRYSQIERKPKPPLAEINKIICRFLSERRLNAHCVGN